MPYLFDPSKLSYSGNKIAVRNLLSVCNSYEEVYSNVRAQIVLAQGSLESWYSVWNSAFPDVDATLDPKNDEHILFVKQLGIILDMFYQNVESLATLTKTPITIQHEFTKFKFYVPINNNRFTTNPTAVKSIENLVINCTPEVLALIRQILNTSNINRLLLEQYNLTNSEITNITLNTQDISGYNVTKATAVDSYFEYCDISQSGITNSIVFRSRNESNILTGCDVSNCVDISGGISFGIYETSLNNCKIMNSEIYYNSSLLDSYVEYSKMNNSYLINSYANHMSEISGCTITRSYCVDVSNFSMCDLSNSDISDCSAYNCTFSECSFVKGTSTSNLFNNTTLTDVKVMNTQGVVNNTGTANVNDSFLTCWLKNTKLRNCILYGTNTKLTASSASNEMKGFIDGSILVSCDLSGMIVNASDLSGCNLFNCRLTNNTQSGKRLYNCTITDCIGDSNIIINSSLTKSYELVDSKLVTVQSNDIEYSSNFYRNLKLKYLTARVNNIGVYNNKTVAFDYINDISQSNCLIGGRYFLKIGDFNTKIINIDLQNKTLNDILKLVNGPLSVQNKICPTPYSVYDTNCIYDNVEIPLVDMFKQLHAEVDFSSGLLEDSKHVFNALL